MTDILLTLCAMVVELGLPILLLILAQKFHNLRKHITFILGGLCPLLLIYLTLIVHLALGIKDTEFASHAIWIMSFPIYIGIAIISLLISLFARRPQGTIARFLVGCLLPVIGFGAILLGKF